ncbi:MAG: AAA family ATPase [Betaproteobacteria bacterium]|nr:MAG: AAA family ATPase [Betaproteobacteria bacterium]
MGDENGPLRIIYLEAENVKRLKAVRLAPDQTLVRIEGKNTAGKTSVLDAIAAALGGGKEQPALPVRAGQKKARVQVDLGDSNERAYSVERRWTAVGGTTLIVTEKSGERLGSPQKVLDALIGDCTFDPLEFVNMKPSDQTATLKRLAGLDWSKLDAEREAKFAERTTVNREAKAAKARVGTPVTKPASMKPIDLAELAEKQQKALTYNQDINEIRRLASEAEKQHADAEDAVGDARRTLAKAEEQLKQMRAAAQEAAEKALALRADANKMEPVELGDIRGELHRAKQHNEAIIAYQGFQERQAIADDWARKADALSQRLEAIDQEKAGALAAAKFPLQGLGIDVHGVTLDGIPFSEASRAEQWRTGVAIGLAQKPRCRVILIRDGSSLDAESLEALHAIAEENEAQVFIERVADKASPSAVFIEDGEIVEATEEVPV